MFILNWNKVFKRKKGMLHVKETVLYKYEEVCSQSQFIELIIVVNGFTYCNNTCTCMVSSSLSAV